MAPRGECGADPGVGGHQRRVGDDPRSGAPLVGGRSAPGNAEHGTECRSCPLCAGLAALRGHRPDLLEALADVLTSAATALRSTARPTPDGAAADPAPEPTAPPEETVPHPAPAPTVQRIDVA